jgi:hypothetical protein
VIHLGGRRKFETSEICDAMRLWTLTAHALAVSAGGALCSSTRRDQVRDIWCRVVSVSVALGDSNKRLSLLLVRGDRGSCKREDFDEEEEVRDERDL